MTVDGGGVAAYCRIEALAMSVRMHAVVLGGSMVGLGTARALANHFERVTVVERDPLPHEPGLESRKGVPQGNHGHGLLAPGYRILDAYFPGMMDELVANGASRGDVTGDFLWYQFGGWKLRADSGLSGVVVSRPYLESQVRQRVRALPNVTFLENHDAVEPIFDADRGRVCGLRVLDRANKEERALDADLVVDASGRGSQSPKWFAQWGYGEVEVSTVKVDIGYATAQFDRRPGDFYGAMGAIVAGTPPMSKRGAGVFGVEGSRWIVTLGSWLHDYPPTELDGFREFARSLPVSAIYDVIKDREPRTQIFQYRFPTNRQFHYGKLRRFPEGYLVIGDAICSFNPIYGQGMAVGLSEVRALDECLASGAQRLAERFFALAAKLVANPWAIATGEDFRFPEVEGLRPPGSGLVNRYMERAHRAAQTDPVVLRRFFEVVNLLAAPTAMMSPRIAWRVLMGGGGVPQGAPLAKTWSSSSN
jgi:2-polyprenyl-6-methoxyphenol hydroxylase-like FAD-dependent oxidoreductase